MKINKYFQIQLATCLQRRMGTFELISNTNYTWIISM